MKISFEGSAILVRRNATIPGRREVKFGPVSDDESAMAYMVFLAFDGDVRKSIRAAVEDFARSRGVL
jgi:hypothetical protein